MTTATTDGAAVNTALDGLIEGPTFVETFTFDVTKKSTHEFHTTQPDKERRLFSFDGRMWVRQYSTDTAAEEMEVPLEDVVMRVTIEYFGKPQE